MRRFQKQLAFLFGGIALMTYMSVRFFPQDTTDTAVIAIQESQNYMQVYMLDDDQTLVPLSIEVDEDLTVEDKLQLLVAYMSGKQTIQNFYPLFQEECRLLNVSIEDGIAVLNFDDTFKQYDESNELRLLEAISWGATQFQEIEQVQIQINGETLTHMPNGQTPIPEVLNRSIGINHFETASSTLHDSHSLTVFCTKSIDGNTYVIPQTRRVQGDTDLVTQLDLILEDIRVSTNLTQPLYDEQVSVSTIQLQDGVLILDVDKNLLGSDQQLLQDAYHCLVLSLALLDGVEQITVRVDGESVSVVEDQEVVSVADLYYNEVIF